MNFKNSTKTVDTISFNVMRRINASLVAEYSRIMAKVEWMRNTMPTSEWDDCRVDYLLMEADACIDQMRETAYQRQLSILRNSGRFKPAE